MSTSKRVIAATLALLVVLSVGTAMAATGGPGVAASMTSGESENETTDETTTAVPNETTVSPVDNETINVTTPEPNATTPTPNETPTAQPNATAIGESFRLVDLQIPSSVTAGENLTVVATIANPNDFQDAQEVQVRVNGQVVERGTLGLGAGEAATLAITIPAEELPRGFNAISVLTRDTGAVALVAVGQAESFQVTNLTAPENVTVGENVTVTATVANPNAFEDTQTVEFRFDGAIVERRSVAVGANATEQVTFEVSTAGIPPGTYVHGVFTRDDGLVAFITLQEPMAPGDNVTEPEDNVTVPGDNVTEPEDNVTVPDDNVTDNVTEPVDNVTEPEDNVTVPGDNVTDNVTIPDDNVTVPEDNVTMPGNVTDNVTQPVGPSFTVRNFTAPLNVTVGETVEVSAVVTNPADVEQTQPVEYRINGNVTERQQVTLGPGESRLVTFTLNTTGLETRTHIHGVLTREYGQLELILVEEEMVEVEDDGNETVDVIENETVVDPEENETIDIANETEDEDNETIAVGEDNETLDDADNETTAVGENETADDGTNETVEY